MEEKDVRVQMLDEPIDYWDEVLDSNGNIIYASPQLEEKFINAGWTKEDARIKGVRLIKLIDDLSEYAAPNRTTAWFAKNDNNGTSFLGFADSISIPEAVEKAEQQNDVYNIPAKQVPYHGIIFRSKLEARWALFFDCIGIEWQYEPESYIGFYEKSYEPDFYFPDYNLYGEVKGTDEQLFAAEEKISGAIDYGATPISSSNGLLLLGPLPYSETKSSGYLIHGNFLYWEEGVNLGDFYIVPDINSGKEEIAPATIWISKSCLDCNSAPCLPSRSSIKNEIVDQYPLSTVHLGLAFARRARFDFDDNLEKMLKENRKIIGGTEK